MIETPLNWWENSTHVEDLRPEFSVGTGRAFRIFSPQTGVEIKFPWWDNQVDTREFLAWLREADNGAQFSDLDQGWLFDALRQGTRFHFLDRDFDSGACLANLSVDRSEFLAALEDALRQAS